MECIVPITLFALARASSLENFSLSPGVYVTEDDLRGGHSISMEVHQNETLQLKMVTKGGVIITSPILEAYPSRDACHTLSPPLGTNIGFGQFCRKFNKLFGTHINSYSLQLCRREGILYLEYESENVRLYHSGDAQSGDLAHIDKQKNVLRESEGKDAPSVKRRQDEHSYAQRKTEGRDVPSVKKRRQDEHSYAQRKTEGRDVPSVKKRRQDEHSYAQRKTEGRDVPSVKKRRQDEHSYAQRKTEGRDVPSVKKRRQDEHSYAQRKTEGRDVPSVKKRRQDEHSDAQSKTGRKDSPPVKKRRQDEHSHAKRKMERKEAPSVKKRRQDEHSYAQRKTEGRDAPSVKKRRQEVRQMLLPVEGSYLGQWKSELRISLDVCEDSAAFSFRRLAAMRYTGWMKLRERLWAASNVSELTSTPSRTRGLSTGLLRRPQGLSLARLWWRSVRLPGREWRSPLVGRW